MAWPGSYDMGIVRARANETFAAGARRLRWDGAEVVGFTPEEADPRGRWLVSFRAWRGRDLAWEWTMDRDIVDDQLERATPQGTASMFFGLTTIPEGTIERKAADALVTIMLRNLTPPTPVPTNKRTDTPMANATDLNKCPKCGGAVDLAAEPTGWVVHCYPCRTMFRAGPLNDRDGGIAKWNEKSTRAAP